jgi:hypothetical protein
MSVGRSLHALTTAASHAGQLTANAGNAFLNIVLRQASQRKGPLVKRSSADISVKKRTI